MKRNYTKQFLLALFFGVSTSYAQVSIGTQFSPHSRAILDLTNTGDNLGLLLPITLVDPSIDFPGDPEGMLIYYSDNLFLKQGPGTTGEWNAITPWKSIFTGTDQTDVYFNPAGFTPYAPPGTPSVGGVGIGLSSGVQGNLHIALKSKDVKLSGTTAPLLIGESDAVTHLSIDNDEIMVKSTANTLGTLKLQEGGGTVQVGKATALVPGESVAKLNVYGKVQESGFALVPQGVIVMWSGTTADIPKGWALCNGDYYNPDDFNDTGSSATSTSPYTKVTPNLTDRFIIGAGGTYTPADTAGGTYTLVEANLPSHTHSINHDHPAANTGSHSHSMTFYNSGGGGNVPTWDNDDASTVSHNTSTNSVNVDLPNFIGTSGTTGSGTSFSIVPAYYALCYIMKL